MTNFPNILKLLIFVDLLILEAQPLRATAAAFPYESGARTMQTDCDSQVFCKFIDICRIMKILTFVVDLLSLVA